VDNHHRRPLGARETQLFPSPAAAVNSGLEGHMAKYDSVGFTARTPAGDFNPHASGSAPSRTPPPDAAIPADMITAATDGVTYEAAGPPGSHKSASTAQPGQNDATVISPGAEQSHRYTASADAYTSTGAGGGHADAWERYEWQQSPTGGA
jgi:hypothetical protein